MCVIRKRTGEVSSQLRESGEHQLERVLLLDRRAKMGGEMQSSDGGVGA